MVPLLEPPATGLAIDKASRSVTVDGVDLTLTPTEYVLLEYLFDRSGQAVPDQDLLAAIWGDGWQDATGVLQVQISRLRRKLRGEASTWRFISRVRSFGYRFDPELAAAQDQPVWDFALTYDDDLILRSVTPHEPFLGWSPDDIIGTPFMLAGVDHAQARQLVDMLLLTEHLQPSQTIQALCADGSHAPAEIQVTLATTNSGEFTGMTGQVRLLTSR